MVPEDSADLLRLKMICARHIREAEKWQFGADGEIQTMVFVDLMEASHVDSTLDTLTDITVNFLREKFPISLSYFVAGPKRGNALLIRAVARRLGCNSAFVKEQPLFFAWIEGLVDPGQPVIVIDDVASDGELLLHAIERLRDAGHRVIGALVLVDRVEGDSAHLLKRNDVEFHYMMSASDDDLRRVRTEAARGTSA